MAWVTFAGVGNGKKLTCGFGGLERVSGGEFYVTLVAGQPR